MANISLKKLFEAEDFKARSKETGKLVHFKSKDSYQAAIKAGSHEDPKAEKGGQSKSDAKPNDMFGGDYAKDRGGAPKADSMATVNSIAAKTGLRAQAVAGWADENGVNLSNLSADIDSKKLKPMDLMTAISGNTGNKYAKDIISKYSQSAPKTNDTADNVIKGLKPAKYGGKHPDSMESGGSLFRTNKKGEAVRDKEVRLKDITPEDISNTEKLFGVDLSKGIENGLDYETNDLIIQTKRLQQFQKGGEFENQKAYDSLLDNIKSGVAKNYTKTIQAAEKKKASAAKYPNKSDDPSYWKDDKKSDSSGFGDYGDDEDDSWGEGPQLTSDRLGKVETALEDELHLRGNGFETTRESGSGMGGWEGPMTIVSKDIDEDNYISLSLGSPENDGKFSIVFANENGEPYFEPDYDALTGNTTLEPQQAYKVTKALMKMPEVQKLLKGEMSKEEFQPIYDKLKAKFSKGKTESTKLTSMIKK
jgi:hypothetical protein